MAWEKEAERMRQREVAPSAKETEGLAEEWYSTTQRNTALSLEDHIGLKVDDADRLKRME